MSAPGAPNIYKQPYASQSTLEYYWNPPSTDGGSPITGYRFTLQPGNIVEYASSNDRYKTITGLSDTILYSSQIEATNDGVNYGTPSFFRPFQPGNLPPLGPSTVSAATVGVNSALVSWTPPRIQPVSQNYWYVIYGRSSSAADPVTSTSVSALTTSNCIVRNLNSNATYYFDVHAVNCPGWSAAVSSPRISWEVVTDFLWAQNFNGGTSNFVNYNNTRLLTNTPSGIGNSYRTSDQYDLYRPTSFSATNTVSFCASVFMSNISGNIFPGIIFSRDYGAAASGLQIVGSGSQVGYSWLDSGSTWGYNTGINLSLNTWTHIVLTVSSSNARWYINGNLSNTFTNSHGNATFTRMYVGVDTVLVQNRTFPGYIDNCRFYTRVLSASEVQAIYQNTLVT